MDSNDLRELRTRLIEAVVARNGDFNSEKILDAVKNYEAYILSGNNVDKDESKSSPTDTPKVERKGSNVSTKKKPRK